jgi:GH25 family lysozyme M1 (1,4-beta-N-acetylmuramidase)
MGHIIDISHHQDPKYIDYDKLAAQLDLVIIRTQYGSRTIDKRYKTHHREFAKRNVPRNAYAWVRGISYNDMRIEARDFFNRTIEFDPVVWWLDIEEESMQDMRGGIKAYVEELRKLGCKKIGAYIGHHLYKKFNIDVDDFDAIWIPHYGKNNGQVTSQPSFPCDIHQYTDKGRLEGYSGYLDLNRLMGTKPLEFFTGKEVVKVDKKDEIKKDKPSDWAKEAWEWGIENGITDGTNPQGMATREEVITMIYRMEGK